MRTSRIDRFFFFNLSPLYTHVPRKVIWMFEILSTCSFSFGSWTVESALFLVCFTSLCFHAILRSLIAVMYSGSTDVDAVNSPSLFITAFSSIVFIKQDLKKNLFLTCGRTSTEKTETFQYRLYQRRSLKLLRTNSSKKTFEENITLFKRRLRYRGYPDNLIDKTLSEVNISERIGRPYETKKKNAQKTFCLLLRNIALLYVS